MCTLHLRRLVPQSCSKPTHSLVHGVDVVHGGGDGLLVWLFELEVRRDAHVPESFGAFVQGHGDAEARGGCLVVRRLRRLLEALHLEPASAADLPHVLADVVRVKVGLHYLLVEGVARVAVLGVELRIVDLEEVRDDAAGHPVHEALDKLRVGQPIYLAARAAAEAQALLAALVGLVLGRVILRLRRCHLGSCFCRQCLEKAFVQRVVHILAALRQRHLGRCLVQGQGLEDVRYGQVVVLRLSRGLRTRR
mmetsp:Transcript_66466/g.187235  ORF Transcript_66466/g.187235 Transcript_66466/m.187235 type:complete len:250 (-) Transcript_66466:34-783(-)